jgi:GT2 family glycosyltransferase
LVYVVVLNYNNWLSTEQCLHSLKELNYPNYQVILVDNGSKDLPVQQLTERFSDITIYENPHNLGFAAGSNRGILVALTHGAEYIWLLNNDTKVESQALTAMLAEAEADPGVGAVGSLLVSDDRNRSLLAWGGGHVDFFLGLPRHLRSGFAPNLHYLCGASLLLRGQAIHEVGLFDEGYFLYWEDTDLCFRLRAKGWKLAVAEGSLITHSESATSGFQSAFYDYHFTSSSIRFFRRHSRCWLWPVMVSVTGRMIRRTLCGAWGNVSAVWKGFLESISSFCCKLRG